MPPQTSLSSNIPPPPPGYTLDSAIPPPPAGYTLDAPSNFNANAEAPKPTELPGASQALKKFAIGMPVGAAKSAAQTLFGSGEGGDGDTSFLSAKVGYTPQQIQAAQQQSKQFHKDIQLQGAGQKVGGALEQTGEMALTGGPIREGAETLLTKLPFLGKYMAPGARVAGEAINTAGNAAAHGQDPNSAALAGGLGQSFAESLPFLKNMLQQSAETQYTKALAPTKEVNKAAAQKVVPGLIQRGVVGSPSSIAEKANANLGMAGNAVKAAENAIPQGASSDVTPILQRLDQLKQKYSVGGSVPESRQGTADYIDSLKNDIASRSQNGQMPTSDLIQFRRLLDEPVAQAGGFLGARMQGNKAIDKAASNSMREILNSQNPDLAAANASYNFWSNVRQVASATAKRQTGQQGALKTMLTGVGIAGGFSHSGATGAAEGAGLMYLAGHILQSPQWRTASAVLKNRIADAIATNDAKALVRAAGDFSAANVSQLSAQPSEQSGNTLLTAPAFLRQLTSSSR